MRHEAALAELEARPDGANRRGNRRENAPEPPLESVLPRILHRAQEAFYAHSYASLTMGKLAEACGLTRRGLYYHFSDKEDVFRATIRLFNVLAIDMADKAARQGLAQGDAALDLQPPTV